MEPDQIPEDFVINMEGASTEELLLMVAMLLFVATKGNEGVTDDEINKEFIGCLPLGLVEKCRQYIIKLVMQNELAGRKN